MARSARSGFVAVGLVASLAGWGGARLVGASVALAGTPATYCGVLVDPRSQCPDRPEDSAITFNRATYPGSGSVHVCERAEPATAGSALAGTKSSRRCDFNRVDSASDLTGNFKIVNFTRAIVGNDDDGRHTVIGYSGLWAERHSDPCAGRPFPTFSAD